MCEDEEADDGWTHPWSRRERKDLAGEMKRPAARAARNLRQAEPGAADWPPAPGRAGEDSRAPRAKPHWCRWRGKPGSMTVDATAASSPQARLSAVIDPSLFQPAVRVLVARWGKQSTAAVCADISPYVSVAHPGTTAALHKCLAPALFVRRPPAGRDRSLFPHPRRFRRARTPPRGRFLSPDRMHPLPHITVVAPFINDAGIHSRR